MEIENLNFNDYSTTISFLSQNTSISTQQIGIQNNEMCCEDDYEVQNQTLFSTNKDQTSLPSFQNRKRRSEKIEVQEQNQNKVNEKIIKPKQKQTGIISIYSKIVPESLIHISNGLTITSDGVVRFCYSVGQFSFGFSYHWIQDITYKKQQQVIEMNQQIIENLPKVSIEEALKYIQHTSTSQFSEICSALESFENKRKLQKKLLQQISLNKNLINQSNEEMQKHLESSVEYINQYCKQREGQIFSFSIGRFNFEKQDMQIIKYGSSKSFLDLIGIDIENFSQLILRHQQFDLLADSNEIMQQSLYGLNVNLESGEDLEITCNINTFDGFPLKLHQRKKFVNPSYKCKKLSPLAYEFVLSINEMDVDLQDLQKLISYREKLLSNRKDLSFEDFIRKELSYIFEDVEYSVHSQTFLEKYYKENLSRLHELEELKFQEILNSKNQCKYKLINNQNINHIQIIQSK